MPGKIKSKWVAAINHMKGKQDVEIPPSTPIIIENCHIFQENTYKRITPCDVCSEVLRGKENKEIKNNNSCSGHTKQGLKCKLCRTNIHTHCQDQVRICEEISN